MSPILFYFSVIKPLEHNNFARCKPQVKYKSIMSMLSLKKEPKTYVEQVNYDTLKAAYSNGHDGHVYDIGNYTNGRMKTLPDQEKLSLVENVWKPSCDYKFPVTIMGGRSGCCKLGWLS